MDTTKNNIFNYSTVLILLFINVSPFFLLIGLPYFYFGFMVFLGVFASLKGRLKNSERLIKVLLCVWGLIIIQCVFYEGFSPAGLYKPLLFFFTPFVLYRIMGLSYFKYLFNIIYFFAISTFPLYLLQSLSPPVNNFIKYAMYYVFPYAWTDWPRTLLFYSMPRESGYLLMRNSGFFHEPGAYSIYLMLAIIINTFLTRNPLDKKNIILVLILLTTFSTAGYVMLFAFMLYAIPKSKLYVPLRVFVLVFLLVLTTHTFRSAEFLQEKIFYHYSSQVYVIQSGEATRGRFFSFLKTFESFKKNVFFGKGVIEANSPVEEDFKGSSFGYGFMGLFAKYGILFGIFYMWMFYKGLCKLCLFYNLPKNFAIVFLLIIHAGLSTQVFFFHTSFVMFFIVGLESNMNKFNQYRKTNPVLSKGYNHVQKQNTINHRRRRIVW